jgi:ribosomal protein S18 acetylase RimI-like enzyme
VVLRPIGPDDLEFFYALRRNGFHAYVEEIWGAWDEDKQRTSAERDVAELAFEIIERDGVRIGYQLIERHADHWFLDEIAVAESERGRGLGTELVKAVMTAARAAGMPLRLSVLHVNPAQRLYARLGFRVKRIEHPRVKMEWP